MKRTTHFKRRHLGNEIFIYFMLFLFVVGVIFALFSPLGSVPIIKNTTSLFWGTYNNYFGAFAELLLFKIKIILIAALLSLTIFGAVAIPAFVCTYGLIVAAAVTTAIESDYRVLAVSLINMIDAFVFLPFFFILSTHLITLSIHYAGVAKNAIPESEKYKFSIPITILKLLLLLFASAIVVSLIQAPLLLM